MSTGSTTGGANVRDALFEEEARQRFADVADVAYGLTLALDATQSTYEGEVSIRFRRLREGRDTHLDFTGGEILRMVVNGHVIEAAPREPHRIPLAASWLSEANEIQISYRNAYDTAGVGFHRFCDPEDGAIYLYTDFEPYAAHRLLPCFDQPDIKATYDVEIVAPAEWEVVSNGAEETREEVADGRVRRRFARLRPFSTYLLAVIAGPYARIANRGDPDLALLCRRSLAPHLDPNEIFEITRQGFAFYTSYFGCPYPFGKYDQIFVPEYNSGAMENVGAVTFNEAQVFRDPPTDTQRLGRAEVILHELAHMWFGNLVTMKWWDGLWLNESFATYISFLAMDRATRFTDGWQNFLGTIKAWAYREDQKPTTHPIAGTVADTDQTFLNFDGITYGKGAAVLKQLHSAIGEAGFSDGLRLYFSRHAWGNTTIDDFLQALGEGARRDLGPWARAWLETSGVNTLEPRSNGGLSLVQLPGNGDSVLRPHRVTVGLHGGDSDASELLHVWNVDLDGSTVPLPDPPAVDGPCIVWANQDDHAYAKVSLDGASLACARERLSAVADPLVRLGVWGSLWEMVRDGKLPPADLLDMIARLLVLERQPEIVETLLRVGAVAQGRYLPAADQPARGEQILAAAEAVIEELPAGSDLQLIWGRSAPLFGADAAQAARLERWCTQDAPGGLPVDQGLRWRVLALTCAFDLPGCEEMLAQEAERDPTHRGVKARFAAETALPRRESKERLFSRFVTPDASSDLLKAGMRSFFWPHQEKLLAPLARRFFEVLPDVVRKQDLEYASRGFARFLVPHAVASPELLRVAQGVLDATGEDQPLLRRILLEEVDELARAVRLRGTDPAWY